MVRVLVADDDPGVRGLLEVMLDGYDLVFAENGAEALDLLTRQRVDVVLLDVMMPRMDGLETLRRIRLDARNANIPVVMLTARVGEDDHLRAFQLGADAYVTKPFEHEALVGTIDEVRARSPEQRLRIREAETAKASLLRQLERRFR